MGIWGLTAFLRSLYIELLTHLIRFSTSISIQTIPLANISNVRFNVVSMIRYIRIPRVDFSLKDITLSELILLKQMLLVINKIFAEVIICCEAHMYLSVVLQLHKVCILTNCTHLDRLNVNSQVESETL